MQLIILQEHTQELLRVGLSAAYVNDSSPVGYSAL